MTPSVHSLHSLGFEVHPVEGDAPQRSVGPDDHRREDSLDDSKSDNT